MMDEISTVDNEEEAARPECNVTSYSAWSNCSVPCGKGLRMRSREYVNPEVAARSDCNRQLVSKEMCIAPAPSCPGKVITYFSARVVSTVTMSLPIVCKSHFATEFKPRFLDALY